MKKLLSVLLISLALFQSSIAKAGVGTDANGNSVGPFQITDTFCQNFTSMTAILNAFQIVQWPVAGAPGVVIGLTQRTSVIHDICDFLTQLEQLDGINAIFFAADYLNELTGKKWDQELKFAHHSWDLTNSIYDFQEGGLRPGALTSESTARDMNDWLEEGYHVAHKDFNGEDVYIQHRSEREKDMGDFAKLSYQRAILQEASNCPSPEDNTNYAAVYTSQVKPAEIARDDAKEDLDFYKQQMFYMGPKFMNNEDELHQYTDGLEKIIRDSVTYNIVETDQNKSTTIPTGQIDPTTNQAVMQNAKVAQKAYSYTVKSDGSFTSDFRKHWVSQWSTWVTASWTSQGSFGALTGDAKNNVEAEFKDLNYECNPARLDRGLNHDAQDYELQRDRVLKQCHDGVTTNQKKSENLLDYYITQLQSALYTYKSQNGVIWTAESKYAGINHLVSVKGGQDTSGSSFQQESVSCSSQSNLSPSAMQNLNIKQQNVNNGLIEIIAKEETKRNMNEETKTIAEAQDEEEATRKRQFVEQREKQMQPVLNSSIAPFAPKGGI